MRSILQSCLNAYIFYSTNTLECLIRFELSKSINYICYWPENAGKQYMCL